MSEVHKNTKHLFILLVLSYFFFMFGNGVVSLTNPDEVFYAQIAKEMAKHSSWLTPYLFDAPNFEKPIFLYWLLRLGFILFGVSSFSARFFPACFALIGVIAVYFFAKLLFQEEKKAFMSGLVLLSGGFYIGLARTVFTDMVFSVLILLSLLSFFWGYSIEKRKGTGIILFFVSSALASLTKGPLGLIIPFLVVSVFLILVRRIKFIFCKYTFWGIIIFLAIALPWYIFMIAKYSQSFIHEFFYNDHYRRIIEAEHPGNDTWYFYLLTMLGGMFPWSIFVVISLFYLLRYPRKTNNSNLFLVCWITVTFLIFQFAHSKLTSYILPMFPALALGCGDFIYDCMAENERRRQFFLLSILTWFIFLFILGGIIFATLKFSHYFSTLAPVYFLVSLFVLWLAVALFYLLKRKAVAVFYSLMLFVLIPMAVIPFVHRDIEPYFSSQYPCEYSLKNYSPYPGGYLLCSDSFARGARFYTDMKIAILASSRKNFFSPHPIPFLSTDEKARELLRQHPPVYGFLKKSSLEDLSRVTGKEFKYQILKNIGNEYIVKIQPK